MAGSEVAQLMERIANEYQAAQWGLSGLAYGVAKHEFITARMEHMEEGRQALAASVGDEQAIALVAETLVSLPDQPQRGSLLAVIKQVQGETEETERLLASLRAVWHTIDLLVAQFGQEEAVRMITAPADASEGV